MKVLRRINRTHVPAAEMIEISKEMEDLEAEKRDWFGLAFLAARHFPDDPQLAIAAVFRIEALVRVVVSGRLPGWARPLQPDGTIHTHHLLIAAAGEVPLVFKGKGMVFDRPRLVRCAFQLQRRFK